MDKSGFEAQLQINEAEKTTTDKWNKSRQSELINRHNSFKTTTDKSVNSNKQNQFTPTDNKL